jgi:hypothetical protein
VAGDPQRVRHLDRQVLVDLESHGAPECGSLVR